MKLPRSLRPLRRVVRRLVSPAGGILGDVGFVYHATYRKGVPGLRMDPMRGERILTFLSEEGWIRRKDVREPRPASVEDLRRVHSGEYLRSLDDPNEVSRIMGVPVDGGEARAALELQRLMCGGTIFTVLLATRLRGAVVHLGGGLHHAGPDRGTGFCLLNDAAVAISRLRTRGFDAPILVIDLDLHDGNGTRAIFADDPTVHTFSMHNETWTELPGAVADSCIAFGSGITDRDYLEILERELPPVLEAHDPGLILYLAGVDVADGDTFGDGRMSGAGILARDRFVVESAREVCGGVPMAVLLAGGYGTGAWRPTARFSGWLVSGREPSLPDDLTVALRRVRWSGADGASDASKEDPFAWSLSAGDLAALGAGPPGESLLLSRYSRREVESALSRFGVLDQARARGYRDVRVQILPSSGLGPTVRMYGGGESEELLMEVRLDVDRASLPGMVLLRVEWLLLQDPRSEFRPGREPLPGQRHPGLGSLADVVAWLITLCEEMEFDGLSFRSSHYHIAAIARRHLRFVDSGDRALFEGIREATRGLTLSETARALEAGRILDPSSAVPVVWTDVLMVVPVSPRLHSETVDHGGVGRRTLRLVEASGGPEHTAESERKEPPGREVRGGGA